MVNVALYDEWKYEKKMLTVWNFLVWIKIFINIHGKIDHVGIAEKIKLSLKKLLFIVDLSRINIIYLITKTYSPYLIHATPKIKRQ